MLIKEKVLSYARNLSMHIFVLQMDGWIDGTAGKNNNVHACFKTIIFQLFNVFSKILADLLLPVNFNL